MVFSMNVVNTKVIANFLIFLVLKFRNHMSDGLEASNFRSLLSDFAYALNRSE
jgi:hypothetical protein